MTNTEKLIQLIKENPGLPVVPMVDSEVVADDCGYWMGKFVVCSVGEFACFNERFFDDRDELEEAYYGCRDYEFEGMGEAQIETALKEKTAGMWTKAIIVNIDTPD